MEHLVSIRTTSYSQLPVLREERRAQGDPVLSCTIGRVTSLLRQQAVVLAGLWLAAMGPVGTMAQTGPGDPVPQVSTGAPAGTAAGAGPVHTTSLAAAVTIDMVSIPGGSFTMGSPDSERGRSTNEGPLHQVSIEPFSMSKTEITQGQWQAVMGTPMSTSCGDQYGIGAGYPVYCVSWDEVAGPGGFIEKLNEAKGTNIYRLPSEAEWEYAARAGLSGPFSFSAPSDWNTRCETWDAAKRHMWWCGNAGSTSHPVGEKETNGRGLHDMHGSVWEWVQDLYHGTYDGAPTDGSAWEGSAGAGSRVIRGGDWTTFAQYCRSASRGSKNSWDKSHGVGFRVASSPKSEPLKGKIGIRDDRSELWPLDGDRVESITVKATPVGGGSTLSAKMTGADYTFDGIAPGSYDLVCEVTYTEKVMHGNRVEAFGEVKGCNAATLTKRVVLKKKGVTAPGTVDIEFRRPVVLLHGYLACYDTWFDASSSAAKWDNYVRLVGHPAGDNGAGFISFTPNYEFTEFLWSEIARQAKGNIEIDLEGLSTDIGNGTYPQWDIIAHSMGGLVSRVIANDPGPLARSLRKIFIMGTPNSGIAAQRFSHFSQENIQGWFNTVYSDYDTKHAEAWAGTDGWGWSGQSDSVVDVSSVKNIFTASVRTRAVQVVPYCDSCPKYPLSELFDPNLEYSFTDGTSFFKHFFDHWELGSPDTSEGRPLTDILVNQMLPKLAGDAPRLIAHSLSDGTDADEIPLQVVANGSVKLGAGLSESVSFACEPTDLLVVVAAASSADGAFQLMDPNGRPEPGSVGHGVNEYGEEWYVVTNPEPGDWEVRLTAGVVALDAEYAVMARSPVEMQTAVVDDVVATGSVAELLANWREELPSGTTVTVTADLVNSEGATVATVELFDDGNHEDWLADDGLFAGATGPLTAAGSYELRFRATGRLGGIESFARAGTALVDVIEPGRYFTGDFTDSEADSDVDGAFDSVTISIGVDLPKAGDYVVTGRLTDDTGYFVDQGTGRLETAASGVRSIDLPFTLTGVGCSRFSGGFRLEDLVLRDGGNLAPLDRWSSTVLTSTYSGSSFGCTASDPAPTVRTVEPQTLFPGEERGVVISGSGFQDGAQVSPGSGIVVRATTVVAEDTLVAVLAVGGSAAPGPRNVSITNPDQLQGTLAGGLVVGTDRPPSVTISHPAAGQNVSGDVTFSANARDDRGIDSVDFRVDSTLIGSDGSFPYQAQWHAGSGASGSHLLEAIARDTIGQTSTATVQFQVGSTAPRVPGRRVRSGGHGGCSYALSPASRSHGAAAATGTFTVTTEDSCAWTATATRGWIHIDSGERGNGSGAVTYRVDANGGATARSGAIAVASKNFVISQAGGGGAADEITLTLPGDVPLTLLRIPAGSFLMGSAESERGRHPTSETQHHVTLTRDYYIGKYEVTQQQWVAVMGSNPATDDGVGDSYPAHDVTWDMVAGPGGFIDTLNQHLAATGQSGTAVVRLPTEAEWEHAARAGTTGIFSFGDDSSCGIDECSVCALYNQYMWWCANAAWPASPEGTQPVGGKQPNPWGLYDMHGNVWEWTADWYVRHDATALVDPTGPATGEYRVLRGGDWNSYPSNCRSASRTAYKPDYHYGAGFRLACSPP